jgi:acylpyruvate hydrolase
MKIICIGRNYVKHIEELKNEIPSEPVVFMKPDTSLLLNNKPFYIPSFTQNLHHEVELVIRISRLGKNIAPEFANRYYNAIGIGIDFTARDLQDELRAKGLPWEKSKAFDSSAVLSKEFVPTEELDLKNIGFRLDINGTTVQQGNSNQMIYDFDAIVSNVSKYFTLKLGDLIYTGTPAGVGPVKIDDRLEAFIGERKMMDFLIK